MKTYAHKIGEIILGIVLLTSVSCDKSIDPKPPPCPGCPNPAFAVAINGPAHITSPGKVEFSASVSYGTAPFTYAWRDVQGNSASGTTFSEIIYNNTQIQLEVADAKGHHAVAQLYVQVDSYHVQQ